MIRCSRCVMPNTRPDTPFLDGVCQACLNYAARPAVDWDQRGIQLAELLDRHHGEVIVPSSGGKDSTYQAIKLKAMGANVTAVTARTCHLTALGRANIDNLARHVRTIEITPNMTVRAKLNKIGLEVVGDISWPEHVAIFTTPWKAAVDLNIPLIMYGENPQDQYGGPVGSEQANQMSARWRQEFGGFLGLRPSDLIGQYGLTERDMRDYRLDTPSTHDIPINLQAHFLGAYLPWDSHENARSAAAAGMIAFGWRGPDNEPPVPPALANWWAWENLDNAQTGIHDHFMFRKYGYGRGCAQISVDVRAGLISRSAALDWVNKYDGAFPDGYAGVYLGQVLERIEMSQTHFNSLLDQFTNWELFEKRGTRNAFLKAFNNRETT